MHLEKKWKSIRVAILAKHGGFLRWHTDLAEGFAQIGAHVNSINLRPSGFAEIRKKPAALPSIIRPSNTESRPN
jgi:hypothetical protein